MPRLDKTAEEKQQEYEDVAANEESAWVTSRIIQLLDLIAKRLEENQK